MPLIKIRNPWVDRAAPLVLFVVLFTGVLVWWGDSLGHALGYSAMFGAVCAFVDWWHGRRRDVRRRRQPHAIHG